MLVCCCIFTALGMFAGGFTSQVSFIFSCIMVASPEVQPVKVCFFNIKGRYNPALFPWQHQFCSSWRHVISLIDAACVAPLPTLSASLLRLSLQLQRSLALTSLRSGVSLPDSACNVGQGVLFLHTEHT